MGSYIGRQPTIGEFEKQVIIPDGINNEFSLNFQVGSSTSLLVVLNGQIQEPGPGADYGISDNGSFISFTFVPLITDNVYVIVLGKELSVPRTAGLEPRYFNIDGLAATDTYTVPDGPHNEESIIVFVDKVYQRPTLDFTVNINDIIFTTPHSGGEEIDVYVHGVEKVQISGTTLNTITTNHIVDGTITADDIGFEYTDYTIPTPEAFNGMTISSFNFDEERFIKRGREVTVRVCGQVTFSGTADDRVRIQLPIPNDGTPNITITGSLITPTALKIPIGQWASTTEVDIQMPDSVNYTLEEWTFNLEIKYVSTS